MADILRTMIQNSGLSGYQLHELTGVDAGIISRFLNGERDLRLETAGKLAAAIGAELVLKSKGRKAR